MAERTIADLIRESSPGASAGAAPAMDLGRVKRNVGKMLDQGAPEEEIDAYIAGEGTTIDAVKAFKAQTPDVATDMVKGFGYGANEGIDATLNMIGAPIRAPVNYIAGKLGYEGDLIPEVNAARQFSVAGPAETRGGKAVQAVGEVGGASLLPAAGILKAGQIAGPAAAGILGQAARAPGAAAGLEAVSAGGAGAGVATARDNDLGPYGELALGLIGGFAAPNVANIASRTYGGVKSGLDYANKQVQRARNPEQAAYRDIADRTVEAGIDMDETIRSVTPSTSANLQARGFSEDDLADIVSRQLNGEHAEDIVIDYAHLKNAQGQSLTPDTARAYLQRYQDANPTPMNLVDLAKEQVGTGKATPLSNQARTDTAIADDPIANQRLIERQRAQPGRTADIIEQSGIDGRNLSEELDRLATTAKAEERAAYKAVADNAEPIDLKPVIGAARKVALRRGGEIGEKLNAAIDLFFKKVAQPKRISAIEDVRLKEMAERIAKAEGAENPDMARIAQLKRRFDAMRDDLEYNQNNKPEILKPGKPIDDVRSFIDARDELSDMTKAALKDGKNSLAAELTELRKRLNEAARATNRALEDADAKYSGNRSIERMIERGGDLGKKLTPKSKQALRDFRKLTPTQQEIQRVAFEDKMAAEALNVKRGNAAADQFGTEAFERIIGEMYPAPKSPRGPARTAEQAVYERGRKLLRNLKRESISTETTRDALSGSRTAPLSDDMAEMLEGPRAAADALTGRWTKILENLSNRLTRVIGKEAARRRIRILTETNPAEALPVLRRLRDEAKNTRDRQLMDVAIREFGKVGRRPGADVGATVGATQE